MSKYAYIIMYDDGYDQVNLSVYSTLKKARAAMKEASEGRLCRPNSIERWPLDPTKWPKSKEKRLK